jgi:hypothetical protein
VSKAVALRTALIWRDEVMDDIVLEKPTTITIGHAGKPTFVVPDLGLPKQFAIVRPGNRGYLLTLGDRMRGTICVDGREKSVADFVARGDGEVVGGFRATPISGKDWGVVDLDESGDYKLFFQFVPVEEEHIPFYAAPRFRIMTLASVILSSHVVAGLFWKIGGVHSDYTLLGSDTLMLYAELLFRGAMFSIGALVLSALVFWLTKQDGESQLSFAFSVIFHVALLVMTYQLYDPSNPFVWPGPRDLTGNYLVTRLEPEPKPEPPKTVGAKKEQTAAAATPEKPKNTATKNTEGNSGGKGLKERARDPNAKDIPPAPPKVAFFEDKNKKILDDLDQNLSTSLDKFAAIPGERRDGSLGFGTGLGTGVGEGHGTGTTRGGHGNGTGGGGNAEGDFVSNRGKIDSGTSRPGGGNCAKPPCGSGMKDVKVAMSDPEGDFGGLTAEEINRVVKARAGVFRACYQKELNRSPGIGGKLVLHFVIGGDGSVKSAKTGGGSTLRNDEVESCVSSNIMRLKFPAKGGQANVNYPFLFQPGG